MPEKPQAELTPTEIDRLIAEKVLGRDLWQACPPNSPWLFWSDSGRCKAIGIDWSPQGDDTDALEVLERLAVLISARNSTDPHEAEISLWSNRRGEWGACLEYQADWIISATGPTLRAAICALALKVIG